MGAVKLSGVIVAGAMIITAIIYWILQHYTVLSTPATAFIFAVVLGCIVAGRSVWNWLKDHKAHGK